jgi:NAD(P)-dependent dehydrogenase (short-subunit alcohol dehydrogenase family)
VGRLDGKRILVTGGTSGIGEATVRRARDEGAGVVFTGRDLKRGRDIADRTGASFVAADVRDPAAVTHSIEEAVAQLGGLDAVVLNAGVLHEAPLSETSDEAWDAVMETNLIAPYRYAVACLPHLREAGGGSIVAMSSDAGVWVEPSIGVYSVSKRVLTWLAQMLAMEAGPHRIRVNVVCPGDTAPGMVTTTSGRADFGDTSGWLVPPIGRIGTVQDMAAAVAFFLSDDSSFCNGAVLLVEGGMRASAHAYAVNSSGAPAHSNPGDVS